MPKNPTSTTTNWMAFAKANLAPTEIVCQAYSPVHPADVSCHTRILLTADAIRTHTIDREHGGGFKMSLAQSSKEHPIWAGLVASGLECWDLRCDVCDGSIPFHPQQIAKHMKAHMSKNRRMQSTKTVHFTVSTSVPAPSDDILTDE